MTIAIWSWCLVNRHRPLCTWTIYVRKGQQPRKFACSIIIIIIIVAARIPALPACLPLVFPNFWLWARGCWFLIDGALRGRISAKWLYVWVMLWMNIILRLLPLFWLPAVASLRSRSCQEYITLEIPLGRHAPIYLTTASVVVHKHVSCWLITNHRRRFQY